jgi:hypothetical protein
MIALFPQPLAPIVSRFSPTIKVLPKEVKSTVIVALPKERKFLNSIDFKISGIDNFYPLLLFCLTL